MAHQVGEAKKPDGYVAVPYVSAVNPFDLELSGDDILWPEGKDVDTLGARNLPAFTFGGTGDGLPIEAAGYLKGRRIVISCRQRQRPRSCGEKKRRSPIRPARQACASFISTVAAEEGRLRFPRAGRHDRVEAAHCCSLGMDAGCIAGTGARRQVEHARPVRGGY